MAIINQKKIEQYLEILPVRTRKAFLLLAKQNWLKKSDWYLAGGTALALQVGHRSSRDLDFFTKRSDFRITNVLKHFSKDNWQTTVAKEGTIYGEFIGAKVSFIAYPYFIPKNQSIWFDNIKILNQLDIAVMKVIAISQRGKKRDFYDLYWCVKNLLPLEEIITKLNGQYPTINHNYHHILKSLSYFTDAENDPTPKIFFKASWQEIKRFFQKEVKRLAEKLIGLK